MSLVGNPSDVYSNRVGYDLSELLFHNVEVCFTAYIPLIKSNLVDWKYPHVLIISFYIHILQDPRDTFLYYSDHSTTKTGPYAVRFKNYKAHFYTQGRYLIRK